MQFTQQLAQHWPEFLTMAFAHLMAVASPGPDFAIVMKHSISYGKRIAIITSAGVGMAIFLHVAYALAGIGLIVKSSPLLYQALIIIASGFLLYLGYGAIKSIPQGELAPEAMRTAPSISDKKAFALGFLTNGLNPKATIFFLSLFTVIIDVDTPFAVKSAFGVYLALATFCWFLFLSLILTKPSVRQIFTRKGYVFDRVMGWVLILLSINILVSEFILS